MATKTLISLEEYLRTSYEHDVDFVEGETIERGMPSFSHAAAQAQLAYLVKAGATRPVHVATELRVRIGAERIRIVDFCVFVDKPVDVPTQPPELVVEIVSPDDRHAVLMQRLSDFESWGVRHVWLADPQARQLTRYEQGALLPATKLEAPEIGFALTADELFTD